ncbi:MAG: hypothetical protein ACYTG7_04020 [Planctomycetota bacterium]|jgi:hypothetical protein
MKRAHRAVLALDAFVNLAIGLMLLLYPAGVLELLALPATNTFFYTSILGAVILGIGLALALELRNSRTDLRGLGLGGAVAINLCGGGALMGWLIFADLQIPLHGEIILWIVAVLVLGTGIVEAASYLRQR